MAFGSLVYKKLLVTRYCVLRLEIHRATKHLSTIQSEKSAIHLCFGNLIGKFILFYTSESENL